MVVADRMQCRITSSLNLDLATRPVPPLLNDRAAAALLSSPTVGSLPIPCRRRGLPVALPRLGLAGQSEEAGYRVWGAAFAASGLAVEALASAAG